MQLKKYLDMYMYYEMIDERVDTDFQFDTEIENSYTFKTFDVDLNSYNTRTNFYQNEELKKEISFCMRIFYYFIVI